jgi:hypothetical protein
MNSTSVFYMPSRLQVMRKRLYQIGEPTPEFFDYRKEHALDLRTIEAHAGIFAVALVKAYFDTDGSGLFEFDAIGVPAAVIEAILFDTQCEPYTADLVAWPLHAPEDFVTALGPDAGAAVLGVVSMVLRGGLPLRVYRTPLNWLKAGCEGCVPLSEKGGSDWLAKAGGPFIVEDVEHGRELRDLLGHRVGANSILVPIHRHEVAAA